MRLPRLRLPRRALQAALSLSALLAITLSVAPRGTEAALGDDYAIQGGWFYTQTRGDGDPGTGFAVLDTANIGFFTAFRQLGGVDALGYPVSQRFVWDESVAQAFQRGVLQWTPDAGVQVASVMDAFGRSGLNEWLQATYAVPAATGANAELLAANADIANAYNAVPNAPTLFGAPVALEDLGPVITLRTERLALQQWKVDSNFAPAGAVLIPNAGDVMGAAGLIPAGAAKSDTVQNLSWGVGGYYPYAAVASPQPYHYAPYYPVWFPPTVQTRPHFPQNYSWTNWYQPWGWGWNTWNRPMVYPYHIYGTWSPWVFPYQPYGQSPQYWSPWQPWQQQWQPWQPWQPGWGPWGPWGPAPQSIACQGDEQMTFDPGRPGTNQQFTISVTSARPSVNVSLQGPGNPQFQGVTGGGKGYIWRWRAQIGNNGTYNFNFVVGGTVCTANVVTIG
jgi:hypothetical protein